MLPAKSKTSTAVEARAKAKGITEVDLVSALIPERVQMSTQTFMLRRRNYYFHSLFGYKQFVGRYLQGLTVRLELVPTAI
eukprot:3214136-Rhodomonas_salina.2